MNIYPTHFEEKELVTTADDPLAEQGFYVEAGLEIADLHDIGRIARSEPVREFCPKDVSGRFGTIAQAENWLSKGRAMFQLRQHDTRALAGYGWTGPEGSPHVPDSETTFALRLSPEFAGRGLAAPFTRAILLGSAALYSSKNIWLETWASNRAAVRTYLKNGAELVDVEPTERPTNTIESGQINDVRLFMKFAQTFNNQIGATVNEESEE